MIHFFRHYRSLGISVALALLVPAVSLALSSTPPVISPSTTSATFSWTNSELAVPSHLWYGLGGAEWSTFALPAGEVIRDVDVYSSTRAFLVTSCGASCGHLYTGNRQPNGTYAWTQSGAFPYILNSVAAENYNIAWVGGNSATVTRFHDFNKTLQTITAPGMTTVWSLDQAGGTVWIGGNSPNLASYVIGSGGPTVKITGITTIDPAQNRYTKLEAFDATHVWALADYYASATADGATWTNWNPGTAQRIEDVQTVAQDEAYGVGRQGWIYRMKGFSTAGWTKQQKGTGDYLTLGIGSPSLMRAYGCCSSGQDYMAASFDGQQWSAPQTLTSSGQFLAVDFGTPTTGFASGSNVVQQYAPIYTSVKTDTVPGTTTVSLTATPLSPGTFYHAIGDSVIPTGASTSNITDSTETGDQAFATTGLAITSGPTATGLTTSASIDWTTTLLSDTNAYVSPGRAWVTNSGVAPTTFADIAGNGATAYAIGTLSPVLYRSTDNGSSWSPITGLSGFGFGITMQGNTGWAVGDHVALKTSNGTNWATQTIPSGEYHGVTMLDSFNAIAAGLNTSSPSGLIARTHDGGSNWITVFTPTEFLRDVAYLDGTTVIAVGDGVIYRSIDAGTTWVGNTTAPGGNSISRIGVLNSTTAAAVGQNGRVLLTTDGGQTWTSPFSCTIQSLQSVAILSASDIWIGGSSGTLIHWTAAGGCSTQTLSGLGTLSVTALDWDGVSLWLGGASGYLAHEGLDTSSAQYRMVTKDAGTPVTAHTTGSITGLLPNTSYQYFIQSNDSSGRSVVKAGTLQTLPVPTLEVSTHSLTYSMVQGGPSPTSQTFDVRDQAGANLGGWTATPSAAPWMTVSPASGASTPSTVNVGINGAGLTAAGSPYTATIRIDATTAGVLNSPQTINVTVNVSAAPSLVLSTTNINFGSVVQGDPLPAIKTVSVTNATPATSLNYILSAPPAWLSATSSGSSPYPTPNQISFQPTSTGTVGTYSANIVVTGQGTVSNSPQTITVQYTVIAGAALDVTWAGKPGPIQFTATQAGADPAANTSGVVKNTGGGAMAWTASSSVGWLTVTPTSDGNGPTTLTIQAHTGALGPSGATPYSGTIQVNAGAAGIANIPVEFTVVAAPVLSVNPTSLSFTTPQGTNPPTKTLRVVSGAPAGWTAAVTSGTWLSISGVSSGSTYPTDMTVAVDVIATGLIANAAPYNGTIRVSSGGAIPAFVDVPVSLTVTAPPVLDVQPSTLSPFNAVQGTKPASQTIQINNIGGPSTVMNWSIAQPVETWVRVTTSSCSGVYASPLNGTNIEGSPATNLTVCVDPTAPTLLGVGNYTSAFTITAPGALAAPKTINVSLSVTADTTAPTIASGSISLVPGSDCAVVPPDVFENVKWTTSELADSQVYWGEQLVAGVPQYELGSIVTDIVNPTTHTGGVTNHVVLIDNLVGGHRYYVKFRSTDRYSNTSAFVDHDPANPSNFLSFVAPAACDHTPPTNVTLTVPPGSLFGTVNFNFSAQDESGIDHFELYEVTGSPILLATISVPAAACTSVGSAFSCTVTYPFATNALSDGPHMLMARAYDIVGNYNDSSAVSVQIDNAVPSVSNVTALPFNAGTTASPDWRATISWDTDKASGSRVDYGFETSAGSFSAPGDYTDQVVIDDSGRNDLTNGASRHKVTLHNLVGGQIYHFQISACLPANPTQCGH